MNPATHKILVVDDDDLLCQMLVLVIEDEGYQVEAAANGLVAWDMISDGHYDLMITDMFMPEMNGFDLIRKCQHASVVGKIILISGGGSDLEAEDEKKRVKFMGQELGVDLFLKKPCDLDKMMSSVKGVLHM